MPLFDYRARRPTGELEEGEAEGPGLRDVMLELQLLGYEVLYVAERPMRLPLGHSAWAFFTRVPTLELALFSRQMAMILENGVHMLDGLTGISRQPVCKRLKTAVEDVCEGLRSGEGMAGAMSKRPDVFSPVYVGLVKAGEASGQLAPILDRLADFLEADALLRKRVQSALVYPAIILAGSVALSIFLVFFLFPSFIFLFEGAELPLISRVLMTVTDLFRRPDVLLAVSVLALALGLAIRDSFTSTEEGIRRGGQLLLRIPLLGVIQSQVILARFCRTMGVLVSAGVPQLHSLELLSGVVGNQFVRSSLKEASDLVRDRGLSLSAALAEVKIFPRSCTALMKIGEETGRLPRLLDQVANTVELELDQSVSRFLALIEPMLLLGVGCVVGFVMLAGFLPIYGILESL